MKTIITKVFWSRDSVEDVLKSLDDIGIAIFADTKSGFVEFYKKKLLPELPPETSIMQDYTNHEKEGYFYFLYDSEVFTRAQAIDIITQYNDEKS